MGDLLIVLNLVSMYHKTGGISRFWGRNRKIIVPARKKLLQSGKRYDTISFDGGIAQLGERLNGIQEVSGSIPLISTMVSP